MSISFGNLTHKALLALFKSYMKVKDPKSAHAKLSASGSERWLGCPGSVRMSEGIPGVDNEHSIAGTHAHTLLQFILDNPQWRYMLSQPAAKAFKNFIGYTPAQLNAVMVAVNFVKSEQARMFGETGVKPILHVEKKVELKGVGFGTSDIILYQPFGVLHVMDYKNGQSAVECEENKQGLYYSVAAADLYGWDFREVWITIIQPNAKHKHGPIRTWKTTPQRLEEAQRRFIQGAKATLKPDAPLVTDAKWCWFCPARPKCPEQMKIKSKNIMDRFQKPEVSSQPKRGIDGKEASKEKSKARGGKAKAQNFCDAF